MGKSIAEGVLFFFPPLTDLFSFSFSGFCKQHIEWWKDLNDSFQLATTAGLMDYFVL